VEEYRPKQAEQFSPFRYAWSAHNKIGRRCVQKRKGQNRLAMNTAELVAIEIVIVLGAVILLGSVTVAWCIFGPFDEKRKKGNSRNSRSLKCKR